MRVAYISSSWHSDLLRFADEGFKKQLDLLCSSNVEVLRYEVPGAFEMPLFAATLTARPDIDAVVCAALVVDGGIYRHDFVAQSVLNGLMSVQLEYKKPVISLVLTPHNFRSDGTIRAFIESHLHEKGREAAVAVSQIMDLYKTGVHNHGTIT